MSAETARRAAVARERAAISMHEEAARRHEAAAALLEQHALIDRDDDLRDRAIGAAANARRWAEAAWARAETVRKRLLSEGIALDEHDVEEPGARSPRSAPSEAARPAGR